MSSLVLFETASPVLAIDVYNLAHRALNAYSGLTAGGKPSGHVYGFVRMLLSYCKKHGTNDLWYALEGIPEERKRILPEYKANRPHNHSDLLEEIRELVYLLPGQVWYNPKLEADDILAMMTHKNKRGDRPLVIVTGDRDLYQFVGKEGVLVWNKDHLVDDVEVRASFDVGPRSVALVKAIFGDPGDNVKPAVPYLKREAVLTLIETRQMKTLEDLRERFSELPKAIQARLDGHWAELDRNWKVVKLRTKFAKGTIITPGPKSPLKLLNFLKRFSCKSLYEPIKELWT